MDKSDAHKGGAKVMSAIITELKEKYRNEIRRLGHRLKDSGYYVSEENVSNFIADLAQPFKAIDVVIAGAVYDALESIAATLFMQRKFPCTKKEFYELVDEVMTIFTEASEVTVPQLTLGLSDVEKLVKLAEDETGGLDSCFSTIVGFTMILQSRFEWIGLHADFEETFGKK